MLFGTVFGTIVKSSGHTEKHWPWRATAKAVSRQRLTAQAQVHTQVTPGEICGGHIRYNMENQIHTCKMLIRQPEGKELRDAGINTMPATASLLVASPGKGAWQSVFHNEQTGGGSFGVFQPPEGRTPRNQIPVLQIGVVWHKAENPILKKW
jgi:hypothetical protein